MKKVEQEYQEEQETSIVWDSFSSRKKNEEKKVGAKKETNLLVSAQYQHRSNNASFLPS